MNTELLNTLTQSTQPAVEAARELGRLNVKYLEQVAGLSLASLQAHTDLAVANLKAGAEVSDLESLKAYTVRQGELARVVGEKLAQDAKALAELSTQYGAEAGKLLNQGTETVAKKAAKKAA